jgi:hypothetical protein
VGGSEQVTGRRHDLSLQPLHQTGLDFRPAVLTEPEVAHLGGAPRQGLPLAVVSFASIWLCHVASRFSCGR